jgi:hypothetical protein
VPASCSVSPTTGLAVQSDFDVSRAVAADYQQSFTVPKVCAASSALGPTAVSLNRISGTTGASILLYPKRVTTVVSKTATGCTCSCSSCNTFELVTFVSSNYNPGGYSKCSAAQLTNCYIDTTSTCTEAFCRAALTMYLGIAYYGYNNPCTAGMFAGMPNLNADSSSYCSIGSSQPSTLFQNCGSTCATTSFSGEETRQRVLTNLASVVQSYANNTLFIRLKPADSATYINGGVATTFYYNRADIIPPTPTIASSAVSLDASAGVLGIPNQDNMASTISPRSSSWPLAWSNSLVQKYVSLGGAASVRYLTSSTDPSFASLVTSICSNSFMVGSQSNCFIPFASNATVQALAAAKLISVVDTSGAPDSFGSNPTAGELYPYRSTFSSSYYRNYLYSYAPVPVAMYFDLPLNIAVESSSSLNVLSFASIIIAFATSLLGVARVLAELLRKRAAKDEEGTTESAVGGEGGGGGSAYAGRKEATEAGKSASGGWTRSPLEMEAATGP